MYLLTSGTGISLQNRPKLGLQYLSAVLGEMGIKTGIFDQTVVPFGLKTLVESLKEYDMVGFYCSDPQEQKVKAYCKKIKEALEIRVVVGGPNTLSNPSFLNYGCDIVVHGEGEKTIKEIVRHYNGEIGLENIRGISYKKKGVLYTNAMQELIDDLDSLPFPDRSNPDINSYQDRFIFSMRKPYITMIASRGCIYRCYFCTSCNLWGHRYRRRSVANVLSEIEEVAGRYHVKYIAFQDDIFGLTNEWTEEFCNRLIEKNLGLRWMAILHPLSIPNEQEKILRLMKMAGCDTLSFGLQSADPQILQGISRISVEPARLKQLLAAANRSGFLTVVNFIFGLPNDTRESIQRSIEYSLTCGSALVNYYTLSVLEGSELKRLYPDKKICGLTQEEIKKIAIKASRKFYTHPKKMARILYFMAKNPQWLLNVAFRLPVILARLGLCAQS